MLAFMIDKSRVVPVGKLFGEFVLIVLGVLMALMVDTGIEQRSDDNLRQEYISRLTADIEADRLNLDRRIAFFKSVRSFGLQTLAWLRSDSPPDQVVLLAAYYASERWPFQPVSNTYEDLQSTGNIRLLQNIDLRMALASYHTDANRVQTGLDLPEFYREMIRGVIPPEIQTKIRKHCRALEISAQLKEFPECNLQDIATSEVADVLASLRKQLNATEKLSYNVSEVEVAITLFEERAAQAKTILVSLTDK
jgi:hypothetical protein